MANNEISGPTVLTYLLKEIIMKKKIFLGESCFCSRNNWFDRLYTPKS